LGKKLKSIIIIFYFYAPSNVCLYFKFGISKTGLMGAPSSPRFTRKPPLVISSPTYISGLNPTSETLKDSEMSTVDPITCVRGNCKVCRYGSRGEI